MSESAGHGAPRTELLPGRPVAAVEAARAVLDAAASDVPIAVVTRIDGADAGARLLVDAERARGGLGDPGLDAQATQLARDALARPDSDADTASLDASAGTVRVLLQLYRPAPELFVVGAGHISLPLARIARIAGFRVTVLDDRESFADATRFESETRVLRMDLDDPFAAARPDARSFVVLVTRAHRHDFDCLRRLLESDPLPRYIGMIGSRRRVRAAFGALLERGIERERVARVRAPLGLAIGAETPEEIAVSVVAEMIAERRGVLAQDDAGAPLAALENIVERFFEAP